MKKNGKECSNLTLLKASSTDFASSPEGAELEYFENKYRENNYIIEFSCPEFTSLCPVTKQPDFGEITIRYIPDKLCIESKSLKLFIFSFRNHNTFHEEAVNYILERIKKAVAPRWIEVSGNFMPRGGIAINISAESGDSSLCHMKYQK